MAWQSLLHSVFIHVYLCKFALSGTNLYQLTERRCAMKTTKTISASLLLVMVLVLILALPVLAEAGRGHHRHGHGHSHHHEHSHYQHYLGGYPMIYSQSRRYYNRSYYPQPRYNYNYSYYPAPAYSYPPNVMMGIDTGNASFMIRY